MRAYAGTITLPIGHSAIPASLRWAHAKGMPMMVTASTIAVIRCPSASHQPASTNQITLPTRPSGPVPMSGWPVRLSRRTAFCPNGSNV